MIILLDMDGVIADITGEIMRQWSLKYPDDPLPDESMLAGFSVDAEINEKVSAITHAPGFFADLKPLPGALEAIDKMLARDIEVSILTSAGITYPHAASEKYQWVADTFDSTMHSRLIITPSKYLVRGDILIDDMPYHYKEHEAQWHHYLFDAAYNQHDDTKPRLNWGNWEEILGLKQ